MQTNARTQVVHPEVENELHSSLRALSSLKINYFACDKIFTEPKCIRISTNNPWIETYLKRGFDRIGPFEADPRMYLSGFVLWGDLKQDPIYTTACEQFNIAHGITIINRQKTSCEFYHFATQPQNTIFPSIAIASLTQLQAFILDFRSQYATLLTTATRQAINLPETIELPIKRYYLNFAGKEYYLTKREYEILRLLITGKTALEVSQDLSISQRTCEHHLLNLRKKFNCRSLVELGFVAGQLIELQ